jgi:hypothetical protein
LAAQGYSVMGIDFAPAAIERARSSHEGAGERLTFAVLDICQHTPSAPFDALFDRGCLHGIPPTLACRYAEHLIACTVAGAHFLLLHKVRSDKKETHRSLLESISILLAPGFKVVRSQPVELDRLAGNQPPSSMPGLAVWLERL